MNYSQVSEPLVSVVIPAFNASQFIEQAIDSVLAQTYTNYEIIVINDGSSDDTLEKLKSYGNKVTLISQPNRGISSARNVGIMQARGEWVAFLDADDYWEKEKLECQVDYLRQHPEVILVHTGKRLFGEPGTRGHDERKLDLLRRVADFQSLLTCNCIVGASVTARKDVLIEVGLFDVTLRRCEDYDLWLRLAKKGRFGYVPDKLYNYRIHKAQMTSQAEGWIEAGFKVFRKNRALVSSFSEYLAWRRGYAVRLLDAGYYWEQQGLRMKACCHFLLSFVQWPFEGALLKIKSMIRAIIQ